MSSEKKEYLLGLVRISCEEYNKQLLKGKLYCNKIGFHKRSDSKQPNSDSNEGLIKKRSGENISVSINGERPFKAEYAETKEFDDNVLNLYSLSFFAVTTNNTEMRNNQILIRDFPIQQFQSFGNSVAVIKDIESYEDKLKEYCTKNEINCECGVVEYYDDNQNNLDITSSNIGFSKSNKYSHENELRYLFYCSNNHKSALKINIGSLEKFTEVITTEEFVSKYIPND